MLNVSYYSYDRLFLEQFQFPWKIYPGVLCRFEIFAIYFLSENRRTPGEISLPMCREAEMERSWLCLEHYENSNTSENDYYSYGEYWRKMARSRTFVNSRHLIL